MREEIEGEFMVVAVHGPWWPPVPGAEGGRCGRGPALRSVATAAECGRDDGVGWARRRRLALPRLVRDAGEGPNGWDVGEGAERVGIDWEAGPE
jgi:hypothetical protein